MESNHEPTTRLGNPGDDGHGPDRAPGGGATATRAAAPPPPLEVVQTIALKAKVGNLDHLAPDAKRQRLFLANTANSTLDIIHRKNGKLVKQFGNQGSIQGVAHAPATRKGSRWKPAGCGCT
jgi:hypothetical protein